MSSAPSAGLAATPGAAMALRAPASFFSVVTGLGGLAFAWRAAARVYDASPWIADALLAAAAALWIALLVAQLVKAFVAADRLRSELVHPVEGSLAALAPGSLLLLVAGLAVHSHDAATALFWIGAAGQLLVAVYMVGRWFISPVEPKLVTPALYVPPVAGNLLAAIAAGTVGKPDVGWLFFGTGFIAWLVVGAMLLGRYLSAGELPPALRPLLGFELAPPALALLGWQTLDGAGPDAISRALLGFSLFVGLVLLRLAGRFRGAPFTAACWASTLALAALSTATLRLAAAAPGSVGAALALPLFVVVNGVVAVIAFRTAVAVSRGELAPLD